MFKKYVALLFLMLSVSGPSQAKECIDWSSVYANEAIRKIPASAVIITMAPFKNDTEQKSDDWISHGIADLLQRYLNTDVSVAATPESLTKNLPPQKPLRYKVGGLFQHTQNWLRIFIQLKDSKENILAQIPIETPFPLHKRFFEGLREGAQKIFQKMERNNASLDLLKQIENETASVHAFENYTKGKMALENYDPDKIEVALIWFQEAKREDLKFPQVYRGLIEATQFLSLHHKQKGEPYSQDLEALEQIIQQKNRWATKKEAPLENRFLKAHVHTVSGTRSLVKNKPGKAVEEFKQALELVPEDPLTAYSLAESYAKLGNAERASFYRSEAERMNPCLRGR